MLHVAARGGNVRMFRAVCDALEEFDPQKVRAVNRRLPQSLLVYKPHYVFIKAKSHIPSSFDFYLGRKFSTLAAAISCTSHKS